MALEIEDRGAGNVIEVSPAVRGSLSGRVVFLGQGAVVSIGAECVAVNLQIEAGDSAMVRVGTRNHLGSLFVHAAAGAVVELGDDIGINGLVRLLAHEPARIRVGSGGLIASEVEVMASDMHPIFDAAAGTRLNPAADVEIGPCVWLGMRCLVLKGSVIGAGSVVGAGAVVAGRVPPGCVAAGNPARVVRRGIRWAME